MQFAPQTGSSGVIRMTRLFAWKASLARPYAIVVTTGSDPTTGQATTGQVTTGRITTGAPATTGQSVTVSGAISTGVSGTGALTTGVAGATTTSTTGVVATTGSAEITGRTPSDADLIVEMTLTKLNLASFTSTMASILGVSADRVEIVSVTSSTEGSQVTFKVYEGASGTQSQVSFLGTKKGAKKSKAKKKINNSNNSSTSIHMINAFFCDLFIGEKKNAVVQAELQVLISDNDPRLEQLGFVSARFPNEEASGGAGSNLAIIGAVVGVVAGFLVIVVIVAVVVLRKKYKNKWQISPFIRGIYHKESVQFDKKKAGGMCACVSE